MGERRWPTFVDVFWSHSGSEKSFVTKLDSHLKQLRGTDNYGQFNNFLDINYESLAPGQAFPASIDRAIQSCRLAVVLISKSFLERFWPMKELAALADVAGKPILPIFYEQEPRVLVNPDHMDARVRIWRERFYPPLSNQDIEVWKSVLERIARTSGYVIQETDGFDSPKVQRLLSDIRLLLATQVLKEAASVDNEKLQLACEDINEELDAEEYESEYMKESVALLRKWDAIPYLVNLLRDKIYDEHSSSVMEEAVWSLDNIFEKAGNAEARDHAVEIGVVEVLIDMLMRRDAEKPAAYCLCYILGSASSSSRSKALDKLIEKNRLYSRAIQNKLRELISRDGDDQELIQTYNAILSKILY